LQKQYLRPKEASKYMSVSLSTIWNYIKAGKLNTVKPSKGVTLISAEEINKLLGVEDE
jgi:excisionase family DNA binding protein